MDQSLGVMETSDATRFYCADEEYQDCEVEFVDIASAAVVGFCDGPRCTGLELQTDATQECGVCGTKRCKSCARVGFGCTGACGRWCCWDHAEKVTPEAILCTNCA